MIEVRTGMPINHLLVSMLILTISMIFTAISVDKEVAAMENLSFASTAFKHGESIPAHYSCDGSDVSPPAAYRPATEKYQDTGIDISAYSCIWHLLLKVWSLSFQYSRGEIH